MAAQTGKCSIVQMEKGKPKGKCRKWKLVVSLGRDACTGKYPQKARAFHGTYTQAQKALAEFVAEINGGEVVRRSAWTFKDYADHFCELREKSGDYAASTNDATRGRLRQISRHIGGLKMQEITPAVVETVYLDMRNGKAARVRPLKGTTLNGIHKAASLMFDHAKKAGVITVNPCDIVDTPSRDTGEKKRLTGAAAQKLIGELDPAESMECAIALCVTLGLRRGEAVSLSWEDVNFEDHIVTVRHSFDKFGNLKAPKTASGVRILPMSACAEEALRRREAALIEEYGPNAPGVARRRTRTASCACFRQGRSSRTSSLTAPTPTT